METHALYSGERLRRRRCRSCDQTWHTLQSPEQTFSDTWRFVRFANRIVDLLPQTESTKNGKV